MGVGGADSSKRRRSEFMGFVSCRGRAERKWPE
jgi:hypothetical protein